MRVLTAKVVTPGLVDAHTVVGLSGYLNQAHDQDQIERSAPVQPELRAVDGYDPEERLVEWVRRFGVTTMHTGHGPGALISGQTMIVKTRGATVDAATVVPAAMVAATLGDSARGRGRQVAGQPRQDGRHAARRAGGGAGVREEAGGAGEGQGAGAQPQARHAGAGPEAASCRCSSPRTAPATS